MRRRETTVGKIDAWKILGSYAYGKLAGQARVVVPLVLLLIAFQVLVLGAAPAAAGLAAAGIALVIFGLSGFLEGVRLSIMPVGEEVGLQMPVVAGIFPSLVFGLIVGLGATIAEPAIGILRILGSSLAAWEAPLLFLVLNTYTFPLILVVGAGVGLAVVFSLLRARFGWSLKPLILVTVIPLLGLTAWAHFDPNLLLLTGLAWDAGGVTTGPVTVPLVVALGIGMSRALKREESATSGLGVVTLASLLPVVAVLVFGLVLLPTVPSPMSRSEFFAEPNREEVIRLFESPEAFAAYANTHGVEIDLEGQDAEDEAPEARADSLTMPATVATSRLVTELSAAARSILPLSILLVLVLALVLRRRVPYWDEVFAGIALALAGMVMLNVGIEDGLSRLGRGVGSRLPATFQAVELEQEQTVIRNFDPDIVERAVDVLGREHAFFYLSRDGETVQVPYDSDRYAARAQTYHYTPELGPLLRPAAAGIALTLLFAWLVGFMATTAEPALSILGGVVEDVSAGAFRRQWLVRIVGTGVGLGMALGLVRILFRIPMLWMIGPPYALLLILTFLSTEEFVNIAWDSAGVTTGPVTVPLIIALGLGLGSEVGAAEGFGIISLASAYPIIAVLLAGLIVRRREHVAARSSL